MKKQLLFSFLLLFFSVVYAQEKVLWDYPIKPNTEEWKKMTNNREKINACQIPENILNTVSTKDLMNLCLHYPLLPNIFAFNSFTDGLKNLFVDFNGIKAFANRDSALNYLLEQYIIEIRNFPNVLNLSDFEIGYSVIRISILELLLCSPEFYKNTAKNTSKEILTTLLFAYKEKCNYHEYFQGTGFTSNLFARAHIILKMDTKYSELFKEKNKAVLFSGMANADLINEIDKLSYELIK